MTESAIIADYLDVEYPDTSKLFPPGTAAAIHIFEEVFLEQVVSNLRPLMMSVTHAKINNESKAFFREVRETMFNCKFEDILPKEKRPEQIVKLKAGLGKVAKYLEKNGKDKPFFLGDTFSFADCITAGWLIWAKKLLDREEWDIIAGLDGGRWAKLVEHCEKLEAHSSL